METSTGYDREDFQRDQSLAAQKRSERKARREYNTRMVEAYLRLLPEDGAVQATVYYKNQHKERTEYYKPKWLLAFWAHWGVPYSWGDHKPDPVFYPRRVRRARMGDDDIIYLWVNG